MKNKTIIIVLITIVAIGVIYFLSSKGSDVDIEQTETTTTTITTSAPTPINCEADSNCLSTNFLLCSSLNFKMEFIEPGSQFIIDVIGKEEEKCNYISKVVNPDGSILIGFECKVPLTEISSDTVKHFFGQDGGEAKVKQTQLEKDYCVSIQ